MRGAEIGRIATIDFADAAEAERFDIVAQQGARLRTIIDEQRKPRAARDRFDAERAGAGEQIDDARIDDRIAVAMREDVEQRLAQAILCRPDLLRLR